MEVGVWHQNMAEVFHNYHIIDFTTSLAKEDINGEKITSEKVL